MINKTSNAHPPVREPARDPARAWQRTVVGELPPPLATRPPAPPRQAIQGLDVRELESQTVFDQLFGAGSTPAR
ncbi:MAG: hypothetical protein JNL87_08100 [Burkholderiaceae bacterium]|nr:hypothetical protein [Burkholderiaceae bacterium]